MTITSHVAPVVDADDDDSPIVRQLRRQVRERLAEDDANSPALGDAQNEARVHLVVHEVVDGYQRRALSSTNVPRLLDAEAAERELISDVLGYGPLQRFMDDPQVEEIGVVGPERAWRWFVDGRKALIQEQLFESDEEIVDPSKVEALYRNGLLMITMPKAEDAKPRHIQVQLTSNDTSSKRN